MRIDTRRYDRLTAIKANFDEIYNAPDPRAYFRVLFGLDYVIPDLASGILRQLADACRPEDEPRKVIDLGCSYGINAALLTRPLDLARIARRHGTAEMTDLPPAEIMALDRLYYASWPRRRDIRVVGQDTSGAAIAYAVHVGLIDDGVITNLEEAAPDELERPLLCDADIVVSTGCVGYITGTTFRRILALQAPDRMPWVANFVLRMYDYGEIAETLAGYGLVTEKVPGVTFVQRRFSSRDEFEATVDALRRQGIDPAGKESDGLLHAELYVSRPQEAIDAQPLADLISVTSGAGRRYGRRFVEAADGPPMLTS